MELRERIINESLPMFFVQGIKSVRMDDIAQKMGISKRTIYEHFADKQTLILEGLKFYAFKAKERNEELVEGVDNVIDQIFILLREWQTNADKTSRFMFSVKRYYPWVHKEFVSTYGGMGRGDLRKKMEIGVEQGLLLPNLNYELSARVLEAAMDGVIFNLDNPLPQEVSISEAFEQILVYFLRGIATERGIKELNKYLIVNTK